MLIMSVIASEISMSKKYFIQWFPEGSENHDQFYVYAGVYKEAIVVIINEINKKHDLSSDKSPDFHSSFLKNHDYGILPALFLFRHYIELELKGLILHKGGTLKEIDSTHGLIDLLKLLAQKSDTPRISEQTKKFILELHELDSTSQGFRYPYEKNGRRFFEKTLEKNLDQVNDLREFMDRATKVIGDFENQEGDFYHQDGRS